MDESVLRNLSEAPDSSLSPEFVDGVSGLKTKVFTGVGETADRPGRLAD
jgi:hypothetical protein